MNLLRIITLTSLAVILLFQTQAPGNTTLMSVSPEFDTLAEANYNNLMDQFTLEDQRRALLDSWKQGLTPRAYWTDSMEATFQRGSLLRDLKQRSNQAFLRMLRDLHTGIVNPQSVGNDIKFTKKPFFTAKQLQTLVLASGRNPDSLIQSVEPQNAPYLSVKAAMEKIYPACLNGSWAEIVPVNSSLGLGTRHRVLIEIKKRLALLGYPIAKIDDLFDRDVLVAVRDIQWNLRLRPDGEISPGKKVWAFLSVSCQDRVRQLQADMEKMRWFPQTFENRFIFVNLAMSYFFLTDQEYEHEVNMLFRTVNGRTARKSPTMRDELVEIILNPFWIVPPTIFSQDKVEDLKSLTPAQITEYFNSHHYEVWTNGFSRQIDPATIDWMGISEGRINPDIYIRQRPHLGNALGVIKFELTNSFAIYLHDTNQRELFNEPQRQLSSGCIRLEKPFDLAEHLLRDTVWTRSAIETIVARPGEVVARPTEIRLSKDKIMPVYTAYLTSQMSSDGVIRFADDAYGQNAVIGNYLINPF